MRAGLARSLPHPVGETRNSKRDEHRDPGIVARWCAAYRIEAAQGAFQVRQDAPNPRVPLRHHKTP